MDLFSQSSSRSSEPLASCMRPRNLEEYVGQDHILGPGRLLRRAIRADQLSSLIFYGPPGTGKTTLARVIANSTSSRFVSMNAVLSGVKDLRLAIEEAREAQDLYDKRSILFVDEVHRWNKSQQDALLPWVEKGTIVLIGATTENPYFEVNKALVSRSRIFQLIPLTEADLRNILEQTLKDKERGYGKWKVHFEEEALKHLVSVASGDARSLLNALQLAVETTPEKFPPPEGEEIRITLAAAEESIQQKAVLYDKEGDYHFDIISAFIKSIRGSDPDGALYWMARMIRAGEDPRYIFRRMLISASEDIGLADPQALVIVETAASAFDRVGLPEGQFHLTQAALYLATCPKSNSSLAFFDALDAVEKEEAKVPNHLKDNNRDSHSFGHGKGYNYPHAFRDHWVAQQYLPGSLKGRIFYQPTGQGYEGNIQEQVIRRREEQLELMLDEPAEVLTYSPGDKERDRWVRRLQGSGRNRTELLQHLMKGLTFSRSDRILLAPLRWNQLFWELYRKVPEGGLWALCDRKENRNLVAFSMESLPESERPMVLPYRLSDSQWREQEEVKELLWEHILLENQRWSKEDPFPGILGQILAPGGCITGFIPLPGKGSRLSDLLESELSPEIMEALKKSEESFYQKRSPYPDRRLLESQTAGKLSIYSWEELSQIEEIRPDNSWLDPWLRSQEGSWKKHIEGDLTKTEMGQVLAAMKEDRLPRRFSWERNWLIYKLKA